MLKSQIECTLYILPSGGSLIVNFTDILGVETVTFCACVLKTAISIVCPI